MTHPDYQPGNASELLPCPFCGEAPKLSRRMDEDLSTHNIVEWVAVSCSNCDVSFDIPDGYDCGTSTERWNTRATPNPSQNAVTGSSGTHPVPEGAADNAPPAILKARGDLAVENRNYWQAEAERRAARIAELEAELQRRSGVQSREAIAAVIDPVAFHPISLGDTHPGWLHRREVALETAGKILALGPAQAAWQPIETAPKNTKLLLWSPGYKISDDPDEPPQFCVSTTRDWCWATYWMPLPAGPSVSSADRGRDNG